MEENNKKQKCPIEDYVNPTIMLNLLINPRTYTRTHIPTVVQGGRGVG